MKKKITLAVVAIVLVAAVAVGGSLAYFTDTQKADNTFTVGNVKITLTEPNWESSGKFDAPEVYAYEALKKDPTVTNTGANPCFVRVKVEGLNQFGADKMITYETGYVKDALGAGWVNGGDGYFYYNQILLGSAGGNTTGKVTSALFDQIRMPANLTNGDASTTMKVTVTAEAVQAQGAKARWADVQTMTLAEIKAWFATCGMTPTPIPVP